MATSARRPDPIRIIEAAYTWHADERTWLDDIVQASSPYDVGGGVFAYMLRVAERTAVGTISRTAAASDDVVEATVQATAAMRPKLARFAFSPTEFVGNVSYRMGRVARELGVGIERIVGRGQARLPAAWATISGQPTEGALALVFPSKTTVRPEDPFPHAHRKLLGLVGAHVGAALRLRSIVRPSADDAETEAVLAPNGKLLHATPPAETPDTRLALAEAVARAERARGRMRRADPDEALRLWSALVQGRWTIVDSIDRSGKRLLLARRNRMRVPGVLELSADERDVAWLAALGHSYKYIAYEVGAPLATVAARLRRAMRKLRVTSRSELLQRFGIR